METYNHTTEDKQSYKIGVIVASFVIVTVLAMILTLLFLMPKSDEEKRQQYIEQRHSEIPPQH